MIGPTVYTSVYLRVFACPVSIKSVGYGDTVPVPLDARGRPDWNKVPQGKRVWASVQHPTDGPTGRMVLLHRGEHGFTLVNDEHDDHPDHLRALDAAPEEVARRRALLARDQDERDEKDAERETKRADKDPLGPLGLLVPRDEAAVRVTSPWEGDEVVERPNADALLGLTKSERVVTSSIKGREGRDHRGSDGWYFNEDDAGDDSSFWLRARQEGVL